MPNVGGVAGDQLKSFIDRIERLEAEKSAIAADVKEVYSELKSTGLDAKIVRQIVRERRMNRDDFDEQSTLLEIYRAALGAIPMAEAAE